MPGAFALLLFLSFCPFPGHWLLAYVAFVPVFACLGNLRLRDFWVGGLMFWLLALYWIPRTVNSYGKTGWLLALLAYIALSAYLSLYFLLWGFLCSIKREPVLASFWFVLLEWVRLKLLFGFPLFMLSHTQADAPILIQVASLGGQWLVGLQVLAVGVSLVKGRRWIFIPVALFALNLLLWFSAGEAPVPLRVAMVQPDLGEEKWDPAKKRENVELVLSMVKRACREHPDLIITPETTLPFYWGLDSETYYVMQQLEGCKSPVLFGVISYRLIDKRPVLFNSAVLVRGFELLARYDKKVLVPFGEFVPLRGVLERLFPFVEFPGDFGRGRGTPVVEVQGMRFTCGICYEMAYPDYIDRYAGGTDFLVNITNDAWFGRTIAPYVHLWSSVLRAVENRKYLFRCANSGISAVVSPRGVVLKRLPLMSRGVLLFPGTL